MYDVALIWAFAFFLAPVIFGAFFLASFGWNLGDSTVWEMEREAVVCEGD